MTEYIHEVYGTGRAQIRNPDGTLREATPAELERLAHLYGPGLKESFRVAVSEFNLEAEGQ